MSSTKLESKQSVFSNIVIAWDKSAWWLQCMLIWLVLLTVLTVVSLFAANIGPLHGGWTNQANMIVPGTTVPGIWARWDSGWYVHVATHGYALNANAAGFFPLYPLLMSTLSSITGWSLVQSGMIISQISYLAAILIFYKLSRLIRDDHAFAMRSVLYMALFPTSFFLFAVYADSLFLALALGATYLALYPIPRTLIAAVVIGLASVVKPNGVMLNVILGLEFLKKRDWRLSNLLKIGLSFFLAGIGVLLFMLYLQSFSGSTSAFVDASAENWKKTWKLPFVPIVEAILFIFDSSSYPDRFSYVVNIVDLGFSLFAVFLTGAGLYLAYKRKFNGTLALYMTATLLFLLSYRGSWVPLNGMARWVLLLFPMYQVLAILTDGRRRIHWFILGISSLILVLFCAFWATGRWVG